MAATTAFSTLHIPVPEDTMEMSSPANRTLDDDIDIDFEEYPEDLLPAEDENMLEDSTHPFTATDEMMDDDLQLAGGEVQVEEEVMLDDVPRIQDTAVVDEDDELIDYGEEEELQFDSTDIAQQPGHTTIEESVLAEDIYEEVRRPAEAVEAILPPHSALDDVSSEVVSAAELISEAKDVASAEVTNASVVLNEAYDEAADDFAENFDEEQGTQYETETDLPQISVDTTLDAAADGPVTPTDTGLHPMMIRFGDLQIPLFKSRKQLDGLLKNDNMANMSLADLIANCRQQWEHKTGDTVPDSQELVLGFTDLGLTLVEDARAAFENSLNDVLETYLQLHHNEGVQEIPPLYLALSPQLKFASGLATFKHAASEGQGISAFGLPRAHHDDDVNEEHYHEEGDWAGEQAGENTEEAPQQEFDENTYIDHYDEHADFEDQGYYEEPETVGDYCQDQDQDQAEYYEDPEEGEHLANDQGEAVETLDVATGHSAEDSHDTIHGLDEVEGADYQAETELETATAATAAEKPNLLQDSTTSHGASNTTEATSTEQHDDTTLNTEYEATITAQSARDDQQYLGSEDFLNDSHDQQGDLEKFGQNEDNYEDHGAAYYPEEAQQEDYAAVQDDSQYNHSAEQDHGEPHIEGEPPEGESEDPYAADADFLEDGLYEQGPEYEAPADNAELPQQDEEDFDDTVLIRRPDRGEHVEGTIAEQPIDGLEDDLDFGEDDGDDNEQLYDNDDQLADEPVPKIPVGSSPLGKRSFDQIDELDESVELPEAKKVRPS